MKKLYCSFIIFLLIQINTFGQWEEIHLSDTSYFQQFGAHDLVESNGNLITLAGPLFRSSNNGESWVRLPFETDVHGIYSTGKIIFLDTYGHQFFRSLDNGNTWLNIDTTFLKYKSLPDPNDLYNIANVNSLALDSTEIFIGTEAGIFRSQDNAINWTPSSNGLPNDYYNVHILPVTSLLINGSKMYAGTRYGGIYFSTNNGINWKSINDGLPEGSYDFPDVPEIETLTSIGATIFALLYEGDIYRLLEGSNVWEKINISIPHANSIAINDSTLFAVVTSGALYSSSDNGNNWNEVYSGSYFDTYVQIKTYNSKFFLFGVSIGVIMSSDYGTTWISRNDGLGEFRIRYPYQIDVYNSFLGVLSNDNKTFISSNAGNSWQNIILSDTSINEYIDNDTNFFKLFNSSYLKKEGGWFQISNSVVDVVITDTILTGIRRSLDWAWIYSGSINNGFIQNNIFYPTWNLSLSGSKYYSLRADNNKIYILAGDGIYSSSDFGVSWYQIGLKNKQIINLVLSGTNLIAQANDGFYKSVDGGDNWSPFYFGLDNIVDLELCGDNLIVLTRAPDYSYYKIWKRSFKEIITSLKEEQIFPEKFSLSQNYPNPFNPSTTISFTIPEAQNIELKVFDLLGREVAVLLNEYKPAGEHKVEFSAGKLASGLYFYRIKAGNNFSVKKMTLTK